MSNAGRIIGKQIKGLMLITIGVMLILELLGVLNVSFGVYITLVLAFWFIAAGLSQFSKANNMRQPPYQD